MSRRYTDIANKISDKKLFIEAVLDQVKFNGNKELAFDKFKNNLDKELFFFNEKLVFADDRYSASRTIKSLEEKLIESYPETYEKIISNKYEFLSLDGKNYVFNFKNIIEKTSMFDLEVIIIEISNIIYQQSVIHVLNELNKINNLKFVYSRYYTKNYYNFFINTLKHFLEKYSVYFSLMLTLSILSIFLIFTNFRFYITSGSEQTVSLALLGTVTALSGFAVVFFQLSFDNFKKYYGFYAKSILYKIIEGELIVLFFFGIISAVISSILNDVKYFDVNEKRITYQDIFFNLNVTLFFFFVPLLLYKIKRIFSYSLSYEEVKNTIDNIKLTDIKDIYNNLVKRSESEILLRNFEINSVEIIEEVILNFISQDNQKIVGIIIRDFTDKFKNLVIYSVKNRSNVNIDALTIVYCKVLNGVINYAQKKNENYIVEECIRGLYHFSITNAAMRGNYNSVHNIFDLSYKSFHNNKDIDVKHKLFVLISSIISVQNFYNFPYQYDYQSGSISLNERRGKVFRESHFFMNVLWSNSSIALSTTLHSYIEDIKRISRNTIVILTTFKEFVHEFLGSNQSAVVFYKLAEFLLNTNLKMFQNEYDSFTLDNIEGYPFNANIEVYSPINVTVLDSFIKYGDASVSELIFDSYLEWVRYVLSKWKNVQFTSIVTNESLLIIGSLKSYIVKNESASGFTNSYQMHRYIERIIDLYFNREYEVNEENRSMTSSLHSAFYSFREYRVENLNFSDEIMEKLDSIISRTVWANTY